jgi:aspartyl-tRNA(Asn)/glutamyl-tRNA(Gln) amidotransferase subunit A
MGGEISTLLESASATRIASLIRNRQVSAREVTEACFILLDALQPRFHTYLTVLRDDALAAAAETDRAVAEHRELGPLHGVPVSVKDAFVMQGTATTVGSPLLRNYVPSDFEDATCVERLRRAGAIILGKVSVGGGMSSAHFANTRVDYARNPWRSDRTPGGSSSGSAVSVALGIGFASVGTDSGGSIRIPAAFTGVVGLKPTYGRVSQFGDVYGLGRTLEHVGPVTRTVGDSALFLRILAGKDPKDPTSADQPVPDFVQELEGPLRKRRWRIGWVSSGGSMGAESEVLDRVNAGVRLLAETGMEVEEITLPAFTGELWYQCMLLNDWEAYDEQTTEERPYFAYIKAGLRAKRHKMLDYLAPKISDLRAAYRQLFERYDLLALPTTPIVAKPFDARTIQWGAHQKEVSDELHSANTWMFNVTGHPAISLPCGLNSEGLPVGLQLVARHFEETALLAAAAEFEQVSGGFPLPHPRV